MRPTHTPTPICIRLGLAVALVGATMAGAQAADLDNTVEIGFAHIGFNTKSGDLAGPTGTTPAGVEAHLKDTSTVALVYQRTLSGPWSVVLQVGTPPLIKMNGAGTGAALGQVGSARAWFPAVLAQYALSGPWGTMPYVGAGVNHASYSGAHVTSGYTAAFGGTSSTAELKSSWGYVFKVGVAVPLGANWIIDGAYSRYGIKTTATLATVTPEVGNIPRTISVKADPGVLGLTLGYRF